MLTLQNINPRRKKKAKYTKKELSKLRADERKEILLLQLLDNGLPWTLNGLAKALGVSRPCISPVMADIHYKGLVYKYRDPNKTGQNLYCTKKPEQRDKYYMAIISGCKTVKEIAKHVGHSKSVTNVQLRKRIDEGMLSRYQVASAATGGIKHIYTIA